MSPGILLAARTIAFVLIVIGAPTATASTWVPCSDPGEIVDIADPALATAIRTDLDRAAGDLTCADMARLRRGEANDLGVVRLDGLEHAVNLTRLDARDNAIVDLGPVAGLTALSRIYARGNQIRDLAPLR